MEQEAWDANAAAWVERVGGARWTAHDAAVHELLPPPGGRTLDVGCGEGRWTRTLAQAGYDVTGIDRSAALVEIARAAHPEGSYVVAPIEVLPEPDGTADLVLCINVLPHVVDLAVAARELARVVRAGGVLVAGHRHPVAEGGDRYFDRHAHSVPLGEGLVFHQHRTLEDTLRALLGAGFALDDLREVPDGTGAAPAFLDLRLVRLP